MVDNGAAECWGANDYGQADAPSERFSAVSAGWYHTCGLRESGDIECWGYTFDGQAQPPSGKHVQISSGAYHACALSEDGALSCWMMYSAAADVPAWLRGGGLPSTGTGGLLNRGSASQLSVIALLSLAASAALLALSALARRRG